MSEDDYTPAGRIQELLDERAALLDRLRDVEVEANASALKGVADEDVKWRLLRAAQSLHRRWNDQRAEHIDLQTSYEELEDERDALAQRLSDEHLCGHGAQSCDACTDSWSIRERALVAERDALARGIADSAHSEGPACPSCGTATNADIHVCPKCHDAWIGGKGCEFLDESNAAIRAAWAVERVGVAQEMAHVRDEVERLRDVAALAQALLERWDMDAGLGLLRVETEEWGERVHYLRAALAATKGGG